MVLFYQHINNLLIIIFPVYQNPAINQKIAFEKFHRSWTMLKFYDICLLGGITLKSSSKKIVNEFDALWLRIAEEFPEKIREEIRTEAVARLSGISPKATEERSRRALAYILHDAAWHACHRIGVLPKTKNEIERIISKR
jgi:hypothetical protein